MTVIRTEVKVDTNKILAYKLTNTPEHKFTSWSQNSVNDSSMVYKADSPNEDKRVFYNITVREASVFYSKAFA
jgi:hypothetical protein